MKNKWIYLLLSVVIAFVLYATLFSATYHKELLIKVPFSRIYEQISSPRSVAKWYEPFAAADTDAIKISGRDSIACNNASLKIVKASGLSVWYNVSESGKAREVAFSLNPDSLINTTVVLNYKSTLWNNWFGGNHILSNAEKSLQNLKDYFEDTKKMYGYPIEVNEVTDTAFLFTSKVTANNTKRETFKKLFESLIQYANEKNAGYNGSRIFYTLPYGKDSIQLFTSIGITNTDSIGVSGNFSLKKMPNKGHLLVAFYQGRFGEVSKVVGALEQFKSDNKMTTMAIPFIKLITEGIDFDDAQIIQAKAYAPILF
jgi:hypothetical protein